MAADGADHVFLDLRHLDGPTMRRRFPTIARELDERGLDLATDLIPVAPAAHYFMGGVVADEFGVTSLPGLLAVGEAACTGVHGANRLASNSLLEGLVFGRKAAAALHISPIGDAGILEDRATSSAPDGLSADLPSIRSAIRQTMSRHVSVVRDATGLMTAIAELDRIAEQLPVQPSGRAEWVTANMVMAARAIATAALLREDSRGAHFRSDYPTRNPALDGLHYIWKSGLPEEGAWTLDTLSSAIPVVRT
jgi:aspartate oxidase